MHTSLSSDPETTNPMQVKKNEVKNSKFSSLKGFLFAGLSVIFYSIDAVLVKSVKNLHPVQLSLYRFIAFFSFCAPEVIACGEKLIGPKDARIFIFLRAILGGISIYLVYTSYHFLPLGETFVIISSMPIFVTFAACIFLKEPCNVFQSLLVVLTVTGIIFTTKVPSKLMGKATTYTIESVFGILAAFGALLCRTFMMICVRRAKQVHHSVILFNYAWVSIIENLIFSFILTDIKKLTCGVQWFYILLMGFSAYLGQVFLTLALKCEFAGPVSTIMSAGNIVVAFFWQIFFFHDIPDYFTITGAMVVVFCIILTSLRRWAPTLSENSVVRRRLKWILT